MKKSLYLLVSLLLAMSIASCGKNEAGDTRPVTDETVQLEDSELTESTDREIADETARADDGEATDQSDSMESEDEDEEVGSMKLYINDTEIPVTWEDNATVNELTEATASEDITVSMSMYGGWEQVGSLGKSYTRNDKQITATNGDIVLYSGNQIVVFYGSNSWSYTRLGRMNLTEDEITELLSNGDVTLTIKK